MSLTIAAQVSIRYGGEAKGTEEVKALLDDNYVITAAYPWTEGPNWGGESPERVGMIIKLEKRS